jgi:acyl carrier protein
MAVAEDMPRNELEQALADLWIRALGVDRLGIHDDFVDLGGHSLIAIELVAEISELLGLEVLVSDLMKARTVAGLAAAIARTLAERAGPEAIAQLTAEIPPHGRTS